MPRLDACRAIKPFPRPQIGGKRLLGQLVIVFTLWFPAVSSAEQPPEIHVLIDVSGSMKETDPDNLRGPALRLLADLVSERSRVQVDLFGDRVSTLLPAAQADAETRRRMREAAGRIRSDEPLTDIPAALEAADGEWADAVQRHVILLSDGRVDVSGQDDDNASATAYLRDEVIPSLIESRVQVHTVALSAFADTDMLAEIADRTGGLAISARSSADLQRAFLALFEATAPRTGLPLADNRIQVDDSVRELTLVIFRETGAYPTRVRLPDGEEVDVERAEEMDGWRWDDSAGRDLVTVSRPAPGTWELLAREDPDNRALVITDLDLAMSEVPGRVHHGEIIEGHLALTDRGKPLIEPRLAAEMTMTLQVLDPEGEPGPSMTLDDRGEGDDRRARDGYYDFRLALPGPAGAHTMVGRIEGPTFERVIRRKVALSPTRPFEVRLLPAEEVDERPAPPTLVVEQDASIVDPETTRLTAEILCPRSEANRTEVTLTGSLSRIALPPRVSPACRLSGEIRGRSREDREIRLPFELDIPEAPARANRANTALPADTAWKKPAWLTNGSASALGDTPTDNGERVDLSEHQAAIWQGLVALLALAFLTVALMMRTARARRRLIDRARS